MGSLGYVNVSGNEVVGANTVAQGSLPANTTWNALEAFRDLDGWRRALGEGSMGISVAGRIPLRARVAHQRVLDEFAVIAKKCRKRRRLSLEAMAQQSGIPVKRIQQFERGAVAASEPEVVRLSAVYGVGAAAITRRLKRVFDQFAGDDVRAIENILHLKWNNLRRAAAGRISAGAVVAFECHDARHGADHEVTMTEWPAFRPAGLAERILSECIHLLRLTTCIQALVAHDGAPVALQGTGHFPQPSSAGTTASPIKVVKGHDVLALICSNLNGIVDRLDLLRRHRAQSNAGGSFTQSQEIGDVVPFPDLEIQAERARIVSALRLIARYQAQALLGHPVRAGVQVPIEAASPCARNDGPVHRSVSTLTCAIDELSEATYNLFQLSDHCP
jgi:transcriptional regulator with XRE-family HTH domain